ncbi:F-box/LRR-repeat protein 15 [Biomphalaria pfeifferi]|uniref:F-box/LRR-repeat protein 15 n=1 Tax=Biomphalaria pfeifferi TaxID=112525 RepID=A0AAD8BQW3_BIOPF|nr:F-box/LRR-repeat protein 15 [Biomphalaria pfeifferi]
MLIQSSKQCSSTSKYQVKSKCPLYALHINDLPDEVLVRIFSFLRPVEDDLPALAMVCRKWRRILQTTSQLWRDLHINPSVYQYYHFSMVCCIFRVYGFHVHRLTWYKNSPVYESMFALIPRLYNLRYLRLPILWTRVVVESLQTLSQLEYIQINGGFSLTDEDLELIAESFPKLKDVSLNACWRVTAAGVDDFLSSLEHLETFKLKINSGLPLHDVRSEQAMREGGHIAHTVSETLHSHCLSVLCLHFVPIEMDELWTVVKRLTSLKKLSISNCEHLHGIRLVSESLQKFYLFNLWNVLFVSVDAPDLRHITVDTGMESVEHLELFTPKLRRACINGSNVLRSINIKSEKLCFLELSNCEVLDMRNLREQLKRNSSLVCFRLGCVSQDSLLLDEDIIPNLQEFCMLGDFACEAVHLRSPSLRLFHTDADNDIITLNHIYVTANHMCKVALIGIPALKTITIQCVSVDAIELNLCSDDQLQLDSCIIQALSSIGFLRLFDCKVNLLSLSTPLARTVVLYRCHVSDYALQMALHGCPNISHLNLEKCRTITKARTPVSLEAQPLKFLNMFGCRDIHRLQLDCPQLLAINLGQCPNVRLYLAGVEQDINAVCDSSIQVVKPCENIRWTHDYPPQLYVCG